MRKDIGLLQKAVIDFSESGVFTIIAESVGEGAKKWGKLKSGAGWISLDYCKKI